ncbi:MAG: cytochrome c biogenesis protein CcsA [Phycisphaerae bacterium]|nr:cytochrome c biogenesis protein CcsA [Phycisphaerae bacterium]
MPGNLRPFDLLMYVALAEFGLAFVAFLLKQRRLGWGQYALAFSMAAALVVIRAIQVGHAPMRNLFEVFLLLAALMFPLSLFSRFVLKVRGEMFDVLTAAVLLVPPAFVFSAEPQPLPPALQSPFFAPHVSAYMLAYVILAKAAVAGVAGRIREKKNCGLVLRSEAPLRRVALRIVDCGLKDTDRAVYRLVCLGFPFLTAGLLSGALWGKQAWGDWWNWDPKELWSLATWLIYVAYFHIRGMAAHRRPMVEISLVVVGLVFIVITLLWVNLSRLFPGLHSYAT